MEKTSTLFKTIFGFILAGLAFSGYLSGVKLFTATCAFGVQCPYFLGYPACYTGFLVYAVLTVLMIMAQMKNGFTKGLLLAVTGFSLFGALFSGYLTATELPILFSDGFMAFVYSLPLCSIGFIFYTIIFILSLKAGKKMDGRGVPTQM
jgi:uncharacterized membrane protein